MSEEVEYKLDDSVTERDLLHRIARELTSLRKINTELVRFMRDAETEVPESLRRFANYFHDLHDIKYMYEEHGTIPPLHVLQEIERLDDRYRQILKGHNTDGGAIEKIRREMAADPENRYDHAKQLTFKRSGL
jgi:septation ring formation regulator EzrA